MNKAYTMIPTAKTAAFTCQLGAFRMKSSGTTSQPTAVIRAAIASSVRIA